MCEAVDLKVILCFNDPSHYRYEMVEWKNNPLRHVVPGEHNTVSEALEKRGC